jgi:Tfp pilus assembly protein PilF
MKKLIIIIITSYLIQVTAHYWLADYYYTQGGKLNLERAVELSPNEAIYRTKLAQEYVGSSPQLVEEQLNLAIELSPKNIKLLKQVAKIQNDIGQPEASLNTYKIAASLAPTDAQTWYSLALAYVKVGNVGKSKKTLEKTLELKPNYEMAQKLMGYLK